MDLDTNTLVCIVGFLIVAGMVYYYRCKCNEQIVGQGRGCSCKPGRCMCRKGCGCCPRCKYAGCGCCPRCPRAN